MQRVQSSRSEIKMHRIDGAAEKSGLSRSTLYNHIRSGALESVKIGGARLIPDSALRRLLQIEEPADA
jgi:excisionase family DNA binding protein